jgi:Tol biopolymer transport system component
MRYFLAGLLMLAYFANAAWAADRNPDPTAEQLAREVRDKGWIVYGARSEKGDWDLFLCRPDGSGVRNITRTPDANEAYPLFSRDGRHLLYRKLPKDQNIDGNNYGTQSQLMIANSDGSHPVSLGESGQFPWASWSPDGKQIACLTIKGIDFVDLAIRKVVRTLPRQGFFQQMTWSPDGQWLSGVANNLGTAWSVARMSCATGKVNGVSSTDCCTPDWFPDSGSIIFSKRPGQWTQLWMADVDGQSPRLLYAEDGRHVYGGHVSPDGKYVLFTGNMKEDGDPGNAGAPMNLIRFADAPILGGDVRQLKGQVPNFRTGPLLSLPIGWEPCWTASESPAGGDGGNAPTADSGSTVDSLAKELHEMGMIAFSAKTDAGDWDLFLCRPDGSDRQPLTKTPEFNEAGVRFSPDGRRMLYYRMPKGEPLDNNTYGTFELIIANADSTNVISLGNDYKWASWGPDGNQIACIAGGSIRIVDLATRKTVRELPRRGIVQQLGWSPDGQWFSGTANGLGQYWNIARLNARTGEINAISETDRYNCTPDWLTDSQRVVYSRGIIPEKGGYAELWVGSGDGRERQTIYAEENCHIYGGCVSPDGKYMLFTRSESDLGKVENSRTSMSVVRLADAPVVVGDDSALRSRFPKARTGPRLDLSWGWEPHWTSKEIKPASSR